MSLSGLSGSDLGPLVTAASSVAASRDTSVLVLLAALSGTRPRKVSSASLPKSKKEKKYWKIRLADDQ